MSHADAAPAREVWSSRWAFILAATGSAVGLGNIWKFPYMAGENGGGAFVLVYLLCILTVGLPILMAETLLGRRGGGSPVASMRKLARDNGVSSRWVVVGGLGALSGFLVLSFYTMIGGWTLYYVLQMALGGLAQADMQQATSLFDDFQSSFWQPLLGHTLFMLMTLLVVARGVRAGIEQSVRIMMPLLFVLLLVLAGYAVLTAGAADTARFLFSFDFDRLSGSAVIYAVGHSFFSLSLALGAIMAYGAYMPKEVLNRRTGTRAPISIASTMLIVVVLDTIVSLVSGFMIFPVVFAKGMEPTAGPGLLFLSLPVALAEMPFGLWVGTAFFVLVVFAAWTSSISIMEPSVAWLMDKGLGRRRAAWLIGTAAWLLGVGSVLSFSFWQGHTLFGMNFFELLDFVTTNVMLPLGGFLIAIFAGWKLKETHARKELAMKRFGLYMLWRAMIRVFSPLALVVLTVFSLYKAVSAGLEVDVPDRSPAVLEQAAPQATLPDADLVPEPVSEATLDVPGVRADAQDPVADVPADVEE